MTPAVAEALRRHEHQALAPAEIELAPEAPIDNVLKVAQKRQLEILTTDPGLQDHLFETRAVFPRTIVYLRLDGGDVEQDDAIDRLFKRYRRLAPGRLYTVTESRVKIRQLPTAM